jgi:valyl-tRNA synthetase
VIATVQAVRSWRDGSGVRPWAVLEARLSGLDGLAPLVCRLARLEVVEDDREPVATIPVTGVQVDLLTGVDPQEAARKVAAERDRLQAEIRRAEGKLANDGFVAKAPPQVVAAEREKLERLRAELDAL